nr:putative ribonuclease H-like domain-containing protein [Tanacetum cinerariifolium]
MTIPNPHSHVVPAAVLIQSKLVSFTAVRPVTTVVPKTSVTRPRQAKTVVTKPNSPPRRLINRSPSPKASTFPPKFTAVKAPMVNAAQDNPQHALKDKGVIDSKCSRHMTGNISYLSDFEDLNGGYVAYGGNPKGDSLLPIPFWAEAVNTACYVQNKANFKGRLMKDFLLDTLSTARHLEYLTVEPVLFRRLCFQDTEKEGEEGTQSYVLFSVLSDGSTNSQNNNKDAHADGKEHDDDIQKSVSPNIHSSSSGAQTRKQEFKEYNNNSSNGVNAAIFSTRSMARVIRDQGGISQLFNEDFHTCMFAYFLSQEEPKRVHQALKDPSWIEAMQEELLQFKMQKVWILVDLPYGKRAISTKWVYKNKNDERGIVIRNKARLIAQGHT